MGRALRLPWWTYKLLQAKGHLVVLLCRQSSDLSSLCPPSLTRAYWRAFFATHLEKLNASLTFHCGSAMTEKFLCVAAKPILALVNVTIKFTDSWCMSCLQHIHKKKGKLPNDTEVFLTCRLFSRSAKFFLNSLQLKKKSNLISLQPLEEYSRSWIQL